MKIDIGKTIVPFEGHNVSLDLESLIGTRMLITAASGGGKSWAIRRLLEQSHGQIQQIVIDLEGEFGSLREKFDDYILAGKDAEVPAHPKAAKLLGQKLLELNVSAILDLYELKRHERFAFVRLFLEALVAAPKRLWHPVLLVIDEAHVFCPEKGKAESHGAVIDVCTRGRKRGLCAALATQRIAQLDKDAAAQLSNKMVGSIGLDIDQKRAADEVGFGPVDRRNLRNLKPGEFYVFGPSWRENSMPFPGVNLIAVGGVQTTHPKTGQRHEYQPPAPTDRIRKVLGELADLPEQAEKEAATLAEVKRDLAAARREIAQLKSGRPEPCNHGPEIAALKKRLAQVEAAASSMDDLAREIKDKAVGIISVFDDWNRLPPDAPVIKNVPPRTPRERREKPPKPVELNSGDPALRDTVNCRREEIAAPQQKVLDCLYELRQAGIEPANRKTVAAHSGYSPGGGAFNNILGRLRSMELVSYPDSGTVAITAMGMLVANVPEGELTGDQLRQSWLSKVSAPQQKILSALIDIYPADISREELAERSGYAEGGGAFNNYVGRLCTLGAAVKSGAKRVRASDLLFPEGLS